MIAGMTFTLGVFDLYTYFVPGAGMATLLGYVAVRLNLVDPSGVASAPILVLLIAAVVVSFVLGHLLYAACSILDRVDVLWAWDRANARRQFLARVPDAEGRPFVRADTFLLLSAAELHDREATATVGQVRAQGLMLRSLLLPAVLALAASIVELVVGADRPLAAAAFTLFALAVVLLARQSRAMRRWAELKTLELCYWIPGIDEKLPAAVAARRAGPRSPTAPPGSVPPSTGPR